ncbi:TIR domain-containing protein [Actinobacillus equuli]|uniref:TIR domain-containing protein n=1 Tax=Actinobacillus equuli TaxID=718 RepID=UPI002441AE40|nr:TIR domain-containing protein [Actinobacillus equuli]WGE45992.1 TIR domain-containing protein [Actinobacillus equuli subsp. haemolyticus]
MAKQIVPPLAVHFIWHPDDHIDSVIMSFRRYLTRDIDRPFSRELNIPTFLYSSQKPKQAPFNKPNKLAEKDVIFLFLSSNTLMLPTWKEYIDSLPNQDDYYIVPVAVEREGMGHTTSGRLEKLNCLRFFDWSNEFKTEYAILYLSHELYRFGLKDIDKQNVGIDSSIRLFLSHAKKGDTGLKHAETIKQFLDNSNMQRFFDANEISPGFKFDEEIEEHIKNSTVIAIESDAYSSRYWCQREILSAKRERRPIILVNSLEEYEDRVFPAASNIPCVHITAEPLQEKDILRILIATLLETVRFEHAHKLLKYYQKQGWIDPHAEIFARPPEIQQIVDILEKKKTDKLTICYPEPALYKEETEWADYFNITVSTPLWSSDENSKKNNGLRIGLSISDYQQDGYEKQHQHLDELKRFSQSLARHLLTNQHTLIYGGDLRDDGFTQFILDEATVLRDRLQVNQLFVENHLAWPLYTQKENMKWYANYNTVVKPVSANIPDDIKDSINNTELFLPPNCPDNKYIWSRCLTEMREKSIELSDIRIFAGGKFEKYLGKMPGVLEEFLIAFNEQKPIFLVGGLGGLTQKLCHSIKNKTLAEEFTEEWQISHNEAYQDLQKIALEHSKHADYEKIKSVIEHISINDLAQQVGLTSEEYERLMTTPFVDEAMHLILRGSKFLSEHQEKS